MTHAKLEPLNLLPGVFLLATLIIAFGAYFPGLTGGFLFDDYSNINKMALYDPTSSIMGFKHYLVSAGNRPLAFLSFLLNDTYWPSSNASGFILTNILLHFLCGLLLVWLVLKTTILLNIESKDSQWIAVITGAFWLLHPLMVSTTLYIVQRITILAALFILASLICYTHGRLLIQSKDRTGYLWLILGVMVFALLAILSKEIAVLIPCYLFLFEVILFKKIEDEIFFTRWKITFIYFPVIIFTGLLTLLPHFHIWKLYEVREFNYLERLLTEARVLVYYIFLLLVPKSQTFGLHYENIEISSSLFSPSTTILSILLIGCILITSIFIRKKHPIITFSILFFFVGHSVESTILPIEIYFEHRNYLPSSFLFFALAFYLIQYAKNHKITSVIITSSFLLIYSGFTYSRATLWGNPLLLMSVWTEINPGSARNYTEASLKANEYNRPDLAEKFLLDGKTRLPDDPYISLSYLANKCQGQAITDEEIIETSTILKKTHYIKRLYIFKNLEHLIDLYQNNLCPSLDYPRLSQLLSATLENPNIIYAIRRQEIRYLQGKLALAEKKYPEALSQFNSSFLEMPLPGTALQQTALLASSEQYEMALQHLRFTRRLLETNHELPKESRYDFDDLEKRLLTAIAKQIASN